MRFPYFRPNKATLVAENSQTNVINDINKAAGGTDRQIAGGVCAAMCAKWIEAGTRNANFWGSLSEEEVLSDIKWIQHREMSFQRQIAMVTGVPIERGVVDPAKRAEGYARIAQLPDTDPQVGRLVDVMERKQTWQSDLICERTGLECETKFAHRTGEDAGRVPSDIAKGPPGYFVLHTMFERGGHDMAVHVGKDGAVHFMDPNCGELKFTEQTEFMFWMRGVHLPSCAEKFGALRDCSADAFRAPIEMTRPEETTPHRWKYVSPSRLQREHDRFPNEVREAAEYDTAASGAITPLQPAASGTAESAAAAPTAADAAVSAPADAPAGE